MYQQGGASISLRVIVINPAQCTQITQRAVDSIVDGSGSDSHSSSSEDEHDNSAEETCSEGSTDFESAEDSSEDESSWSDDDSTSSGRDASSDTADEDSNDSDDSGSSCDEDGYPKIKPKATRQRRKRTMTSENVDSNLAFAEEGLPTRTRAEPIPRLSERTDMINVSISVYDIRSGHPVRLFHFQQDLPVMLYSSPPAIHPSKPLVAWPLGGGDVLFADYMANTYFIRGAVPSTQDSE